MPVSLHLKRAVLSIIVASALADADIAISQEASCEGREIVSAAETTLVQSPSPDNASAKADPKVLMGDLIELEKKADDGLRRIDEQIQNSRSAADDFDVTRVPGYAELQQIRLEKEERLNALADKYLEMRRSYRTQTDRGLQDDGLETIRSFHELLRGAAEGQRPANQAAADVVDRIMSSGVGSEMNNPDSSSTTVDDRAFTLRSIERDLTQDLNDIQKKVETAPKGELPPLQVPSLQLKDSDRDARTERHDGTGLSPFCPSSATRGNINGSSFEAGSWSLTFDDGPHPTRTAAVVAELKKAQAIATFFWVAKNAKAHRSVVKDVIGAGMGGAVHSFTHADLAQATDAKLGFEVACAKEVVESISETTLNLYRLPYGSGAANDSNPRKAILGAKLVHVSWNVDSFDWQDRDERSIVRRVMNQMNQSKGGGGIILMHDIHPQTVRAVRILLPLLTADSNIALMKVDQAAKIEASCN